MNEQHIIDRLFAIEQTQKIILEKLSQMEQQMVQSYIDCQSVIEDKSDPFTYNDAEKPTLYGVSKIASEMNIQVKSLTQWLENNNVCHRDEHNRLVLRDRYKDMGYLEVGHSGQIIQRYHDYAVKLIMEAYNRDLR